MYVWLAIEGEIYDSSTVTTVLHIFELVLMCYFFLEIMSVILAYGLKLYFSDWINIIEIPIVLTLMIILILDLIDDKYRVEGLYRVIRVKLAFLRIRSAIVWFNARRIASNHTSYDARLASENVLDIISRVIKDAIDPKLKSDLTYCLQMIYTGKVVNEKQEIETIDLDKDFLSWARNNSIKQMDLQSLSEKRNKIKTRASNLDITKKLKLSSRVDQILSQVQDFEFDIFDLSKETNMNEMIVCSTYLFQKHNLFEDLIIDPKTFELFITSIQTGYKDVAYHNKIHGMDVGRLAYYYATNWEMMEKCKLSQMDLGWLIIGGAIHDFEHLGWNNAYLIETQHEWAVTYNDISVCENHHVASSFEIIKKKPGCNIFENLSLEEFKMWRKKITKMIIATDMAFHFDYVNKFKAFNDEEFHDFSKEDNKIFLMWMCLHISDITNPTKRWRESEKWTLLVYEEFFIQGDKEKELGLPVGDLNDRRNINLAKSQMGFIDFIVQPSFEVFSKFLPKVGVHIDSIKMNRAKWNSLVSECERQKESGNFLMNRFKEIEEQEAEEGPEFHSLDHNKRTADVQENINGSRRVSKDRIKENEVDLI
jgi:hypothetical protein